MKVVEEMKTICVSEIKKLDNFDIVRLLDDENQEFIGYFLSEKYKQSIKELSEKIEVLTRQDKK